jgi:hypothetical protein
MCTSNVDVAGGIVNGTTGEVVQFYGQHVVQVKEDNTGRIFQYSTGVATNKIQWPRATPVSPDSCVGSNDP